ncbi:MAG TPA: RNA-binding protein [Williamwhitmania sp.]|nr:RNA-binding protein [Williamwhitmania sp.]
MTIYIGNISYSMKEEELKSAFEKFGAVTSVKMIVDRQSGRSKGFAFVEMENEEEAISAIASLNNSQLDGRNIKVNAAHSKDTVQGA